VKVACDWDVSPFFGWGVYGLNLALEWSHGDAGVESWTYGKVWLDGVDALRARALRPFLQRCRRQPEQFDVRLRALGNSLAGTEALGDSDADVGVIFFEMPLSAAAVARAKRFELIITGSSWNEQVLRARGVENVCTVLQGVDPTLFHPAPRRGLFPGKFVIFSGGKAEPRKGQDIVVKAFRIFAQKHPEAMLVTAWHSPWPQLAAGMDLDLRQFADRVIDVGAVPNALMPQVLRECDVALFPNRAEGGTNLVAMEAIACGLRTILSQNTGHFDLLGYHGTTALRRQKPSPVWSEWGESDIEETLDKLEGAFDRAGWPRTPSEMPLTWSNTAAGLLAAIKEGL